MKNQHELKTVVIGCCELSYFYTGAAVYETFIKCYEFQIPERVEAFIENEIGISVPF